MSDKTPITVAYGDGIGPEIMTAVLRVLDAAEAQVEPEVIEIGESVYRAGHSSGIPDSAWETLRRNKVFLKAPITTPQGGGYKSLNVTVRKTLGLYANVRPCMTYHPYVRTKHPAMDVIIFRENEEDLYAGIEHRQTQEVYQTLKLVSRTGSERLIRHAFEYARANHRKKLSCFTKDNIMKLSDGLFHKTFERVAAEYPELETDHWIIDIGAARVADTPELFDVIVTLNLYGDILSDIAAQIAGSVGMAGSANLGDGYAMFEAIHGSAPPLAGQGVANPSALLQASVMMLVYLGQGRVGQTIHNAWLRTLEDGIHTADIYQRPFTQEKVGTEEFADAVIDRLGQEPEQLKPAGYPETSTSRPQIVVSELPEQEKRLVGVDVFLDWRKGGANDLGPALETLSFDGLRLRLIASRGLKVYPEGPPEQRPADHWRCRFIAASDGGEVSKAEVLALLEELDQNGFDFVKTEHLYTFDGVIGYSLAQGE